MSDVTVPREAAMARVKQLLSWTRNTESERKWSTAIGYLAGWLVAAGLVPIVISQQRVIANRPVLKPEIWVSFVDEYGHPIGPVRPDLDASQRTKVVNSFVTQYVRWRIGYNYHTVRGQLEWVKQVTGGKEQTRYVAYMNSANGPAQQLGEAGKIDVTWVGDPKPFSQSAVGVPYRVQLVERNGVAHPEEWRMAVVTFDYAEDMPPAVAVNNDPLKLLVTDFTTNADQGAK